MSVPPHLRTPEHALALFRHGHDTIDIARLYGWTCLDRISPDEPRVVRWLTKARDRERERKARAAGRVA